MERLTASNDKVCSNIQVPTWVNMSQHEYGTVELYGWNKKVEKLGKHL